MSLATAQSAAFKAKYVLTLAAYVDVPASSVSITSVTQRGSSSSSRRRALLQSGGVNVNVAIVAANSNVAALNRLLRNAGPVIVTALAAGFPGLTLYVAPPPAPPSTSWATPGAIAGVVVGGAVAITLIVLLSVFIPRIQHYRQAQVFGQGFPQQVQMQQQVPPGAFTSSAQQGAQAGVQTQTGGKVVSF